MDILPQNRKVVEHNDLISSAAKMDKVPLQIFELAVSCIDTQNPPKDNIVYLSKSELFSFFNLSSASKHARFKLAIEHMQKQAFFEIAVTENKGVRFRNIVPIPFVEWTDYDDQVLVQFTPQIMPYLIDLKNNFTQYALSDVMQLNSKHSITLYKWLSMNYNQFEHYQYKGNRTQSQLNAYQNPTISIEELRTLTDTVTKYERLDNFEKRILIDTLEDINTHTHLNVSYEKIKKGRKVESIQFYVKKKFVAPIDYKDEQADEAYLAKKEQDTQNNQALYTVAMTNPYTQMLLKLFLLDALELTDMDLMIGLQKNVYPLYDKLKELRGLKGVDKHLSYVTAKQTAFSKTNVAKYLHKSIKQYLVQVKIEDQGIDWKGEYDI
ncbi:RepB family plasmid replication initiator protein [Enterococcus sulfureus]|uniref:Initiator Rep protein domain-containing protein n=2 Tax=Enterococcus sulfureus TaxID=1356 RepID=S0P2F8_9ENTE|nr:RepB family plasmid replication initiator protein [Enterococcus sulfureus]EOT82636.1 hypothetical protein I573_02251 [Enterococcus sulfureus ATCC 49903]